MENKVTIYIEGSIQTELSEEKFYNAFLTFLEENNMQFFGFTREEKESGE